MKKGFSLKRSANEAFSLIEILIGMGLMAVIMAAGVVLLFTSLRTSKKAANVGAAKSEGAYAINAMSQKIRYAQSIVCDTPSAGDLTVNFFDRSYTVYSLSGGKITATTPPGGAVDLTSAKVSVTGCPLFTCDTSTPPSAVTICFSVSVAGVTDVTETGSAAFQTKVGLRNFGN